MNVSIQSNERIGSDMVTRRSPRPGVVILGAESQGLGILRQLTREGVPTVLVDQDRFGIARTSRYCRAFYHSPLYHHTEEFVGFLLEIARKNALEGWTIFPTDDEQVASIAKKHKEMSLVYNLCTPPWETASVPLRKNLFFEKARELGVPIPTTITLETYLAENTSFRFPAVLKPVVKPNFFRVLRRKAVEVQSPDELRRLLAALDGQISHSEMYLQEKIPHRGAEQLSYVSLMTNGELRYGFGARRVRQHPMDYGKASTYVEAIESHELAETTHLFLKSIDYWGLAECEYIRDPRDGVPKLIDVNPRFWGWHTLANRCGINYPYLLYCSVNNIRLPAYELNCQGARWIKNITDFPVALREVLSGRLKPLTLLTQYFGSGENATYDPHDPLPFFMEYFLLLYLIQKRGY